MAQLYIHRLSFLTSQFHRSDEIINRNICLRKSTIIFKYLKKVLLYNEVHLEKTELYQIILKIKKWRNG
jgi:hypothetical protein